METWKLTASGTVQGVGFRWSVLNYAQSLGLSGTVKNNPDMTVTIMLQATKDQVTEFINNLPDNISPFAHIENIDVEKLSKVDKMHGFHVLY
ncbi:acylphosphatase [Lactobacillus hamsteri]|uniref:acylphosphatase n=1 Tax=Lactobacillus hamsteri DSM 5661 = JCM 6256 TaxID=1423754 RepID=A0A0R1YDT2_9LACO|nr:acylphosphatase [Lactobacillus hamsteri]KRM37961.1 hypothetical protein FC39_GL001535 [Lactobacillus hamsteri DSM 5661 = JCM 6256]